MNFEDLMPEQKERVSKAKTPEEILAIAKEEGYELSDGELKDISDGASWNNCIEYNCEHSCGVPFRR